MRKNSSKKPTNIELSIVSEAQEKAQKDMVNFIQNNGHLFDAVNKFKSDIEKFRKLTDFSGIAETLAMPAKYLSGLSEQIKLFSEGFHIQVPNHLEETIEMMGRLHAQEGFTYTPRIRDDFEEVQISLDKLVQKIDKKIDEKLVEFSSTIDKSDGSYNLEMVKERNAYCKFCGYQLMRVQFMIYFGEASMKCPQCKRLVQIPRQLDFKEI